MTILATFRAKQRFGGPKDPQIRPSPENIHVLARARAKTHQKVAKSGQKGLKKGPLGPFLTVFRPLDHGPPPWSNGPKQLKVAHFGPSLTPPGTPFRPDLARPGPDPCRQPVEAPDLALPGPDLAHKLVCATAEGAPAPSGPQIWPSRARSGLRAPSGPRIWPSRGQIWPLGSLRPRIWPSQGQIWPPSSLRTPDLALPGPDLTHKLVWCDG